MSNDQPPPESPYLKKRYIFLYGVVAGWIGTLLYYFLTFTKQQGPNDHLTTNVFIADGFVKALPYLICILACVILAAIFTRWLDNSEAKQKELIDTATNEAQSIRSQASDEATTIKNRAEAAEAHTTYQAELRATEIIANANKLKQEVDDEKLQVGIWREEREKEYQGKKLAYVAQIKDLETKLDKCTAADTMRDEIIRWFEAGNVGAAKRGQKELRNFLKKRYQKPYLS